MADAEWDRVGMGDQAEVSSADKGIDRGSPLRLGIADLDYRGGSKAHMMNGSKTLATPVVSQTDAVRQTHGLPRPPEYDDDGRAPDATDLDAGETGHFRFILTNNCLQCNSHYSMCTAAMFTSPTEIRLILIRLIFCSNEQQSDCMVPRDEELL